MTTIATPITTAEALAAAGDIGRCELVRGELIAMLPASAGHGWNTNRIGTRLTIYVDGHDLGAVFAAETGYVIERQPDTVRAPDVSFVRKDRLHLVGDRGFFPGAPDLAVEVLSPDDTATEVMDKVDQWLEAGCRAVWVADARRKTITVYRTDAPPKVHHAGETLSGGDVVPGFELRVDDAFAR